MRRRVLALFVGAAVLGLSACATAAPRGTPAPAIDLPEPTETISAASWGGPPPFVLRYGAIQREVAATTWCYENSCADGVDPDPASIGAPDVVFVHVPLEGAVLTPSLWTGTWEGCDRREFGAVVDDLGDGWWSVTPAGPAGDYTLSLFAGGASGSVGVGDMAADVRWETPLDGPLPAPEAALALIVDRDGEPDSYGLELVVSNLAATPADYSADITVTAANGRSQTIAAVPAGGCMGDGAIFFDGPDDQATDAAALGDFPFTYEVELTLDGTTYSATATYPDDLPGPTEVSVPLEFDPALPGMGSGS